MQLARVEVISDISMQGILTVQCNIDLGPLEGQVLNKSCDSLAPAHTNCFTLMGPPILKFTSTAAMAPGYLREMIGCATTGDTVKFDPALNDLTITLAAPAINVNKQIHLFSDLSNNVAISNTNGVNSTSLIEASKELHSTGLKWVGLTDESLIVEVFTGGSFNLEDSEVNKIIIKKN